MTLENRAYVRERHGVANCRKISAATVCDSDIQSVVVTDGHGEVLIALGAATFPAGMTPRQARFIAKQLLKSADRVETEIDHKGEP